ncbi:MAG TPA: hypothetical protein VM933_03750 [Acidimicrobiales bacterium]|nr:hypothetical protein [Acidimicrobiales bacterium]
MAASPEDVSCRRCRASDRFQAVLAEHEERERTRRAAREERAVLTLIERHRDEFDELLTSEAILDVFTDGD